MNIGEVLKTERQNKGLSLTDIEEATKIRAKYLQALEEEKFEEIPGEAYCMGFLRNYARFLDIDPEPLLSQYRAQTQKEDQSPAPSDDEQAKKSQQKSTPLRFLAGREKVLLGLAIFFVLICFFVFVFVSNKERSSSPTKPSVSQEQSINQQTTAPQPAREEKITLKLIGNQKCWTEVTVDGNVEFSDHLNPGETKEFEAEESIRVRLGNAGGVDVIYNGKKESPLGAPGQVVEKEYTK